MTRDHKYILTIAVTRPVKKTYHYSVPDNLLQVAEIGRRVIVPFKNQKVIGYILEKDMKTGTEGIKDIHEVLDSEPLFHPNLVPFFRWISEYYLFPIGLLIQSALPSGLNVSPYKAAKLTAEGTKALESLPLPPEEEKILSWVKKNPGKGLRAPLHTIGKLENKGWMAIEENPGRSGIGHLKRKFIRYINGRSFESVLKEHDGDLKAKNEHEFLQALSFSKGVPLKEINERFSNGPYLVKKWTKRGAIECYDAIVFRDGTGKILVPSPEPPFLYEHQQEVLKKIEWELDKRAYSACLLNGVTGSGKTEVYFKAVKHVLGLGRQAILMVPEIALSIYIEGTFRSRLGNRVAVFHSGLSRGEVYDQWMRMARGEVDLVIGARSALFAPLARVGLIIVDEEYDSSYKQEEGPRHQARDAAVMRGRMENALVVLGSGTPSVQSYHNAMTGRYKLLSMPDRVEKRPLPEIEIVDLKDISGEREVDQILSPLLKKALSRNLAEGEQSILFLNRRGFGRVYLCRSCGESVRCPNCDLTLTFHLKDNVLSCHYCGFSSRPNKVCPSCGREGMRPYGFGTEKLESALAEEFPTARISRMDRDSTRHKGQAYSILQKFSKNEIDILVGTQMITKGYDFPNVTLVGIISADLSLGFPDFRAGERTFQLISQVAGRAGRGEKKGRVIIQTFNPGHYAIQAARNHDYGTFFRKEKELREQLGYPPLSYLACLRFQGNDRVKTEKSARKIGMEVREILKRWPRRGKDIQVLGPVEAPMSKLKGKYRQQILLKSKGTELLHYLLKEVDDFSPKILRKTGVSMVIDVDPYQML